MRTHARLGLSRTWQHYRLFPSLSVLDNLLIAPRRYHGESLHDAFAATPRTRASSAAIAQLEMVRMVKAAHRLPNKLSYGKQKIVRSS